MIIRRIIYIAKTWPPPALLVVSMVPGFFLFILSFLTELNSVSYRHPSGTVREVGYVGALNWSLNFIMVYPFSLYFMLATFQDLYMALNALYERKMVVDNHLKPAPRRQFFLLWERWVLRVFKYGAPTSLGIAYALTLWEWIVFSAGPLWLSDLSAVKAQEVDWSVAALIPSAGQEVGRLTNGTFSFLAFIVQGWAFSTVIFFIILLSSFCAFTYLLSRGFHNCRLIPQTVARDSRHGFEVFEESLRNLLFAIACTFIFFFLSRLQNLYLYTDRPVASFPDFVVSDIVYGFLSSPFAITSTLSRGGSIDYSGATVSMLTFIFLLVVLLSTFLTLRVAALTSRNFLLSYLEGDGADRQVALMGSKEDYIRRLVSMSVWPSHNVGANALIATISLAIACMIFYKLGLIYMLLAVVLVSKGALVRRARRRPASTSMAVRTRVSPGTVTKEFDVFLAHNSLDKEDVRVIADLLRDKGVNPWLDEEQIRPGLSFQAVIQKALPKVASAAVVVGRHGLGKWQVVELEALLNECVEEDIPVIPVLLPDVDEIPRDFPFLRTKSLVQFRRDLSEREPLRRLVWGVTGNRE